MKIVLSDSGKEHVSLRRSGCKNMWEEVLKPLNLLWDFSRCSIAQASEIEYFERVRLVYFWYRNVLSNITQYVSSLEGLSDLDFSGDFPPLNLLEWTLKKDKHPQLPLWPALQLVPKHHLLGQFALKWMPAGLILVSYSEVRATFAVDVHYPALIYLINW